MSRSSNTENGHQNQSPSPKPSFSISHVTSGSLSEPVAAADPPGKVTGPDIELFCRETLNSATPPSGDSGWTTPVNSSKNTGPEDSNVKLKVILPKDNQNHIPRDHLLKLALLGGSLYGTTKNHNNSKSNSSNISNNNNNNNTNNNKSDSPKNHNSVEDSACVEADNKLDGNEAEQTQRMSGTNGFDRNRLTSSSSTSGGTSENLSWRSDGVSAQGSVTQSPRNEGMLVGRLSSGTGAIALHEGGAHTLPTGRLGPSPQVTMASVFRSPMSVSDAPLRGYTPVYSTAGGGASLGPFPALHSSHGQSSPMVSMQPYSAFYNQFPNYSNSAILPGHYPPSVESYSAVLQTMGSHAAQASFGSAGNITQYSLQGPSQQRLPHNPSSSSAHSAAFSPPTSGRGDMDMIIRNELEADHHRRHSTGYAKEEKARHYSPPSGFSGAPRGTLSTSSLRESPKLKGDYSPGQDQYKVPSSSGREGSLKHRILRPSNSTGSSMRPSSFNSGERSPKRTKFSDPVSTSIQLHSEDDTQETNIPGPGPPAKPEAGGDNKAVSSHLHYPPHFVKGSIIQLANGELKRVESLETEDFVQSADLSNDLRIDTSTVVHIDESRVQDTAVLRFVVGEHKVQVTTEATLEHPFFVFGQGWSSCEPDRTLKRYGLECHRLTVGDICISLTHKEVSANAEKISQQQKQQQQLQQKGSEYRRSPGQQGQGHTSANQGHSQDYRSVVKVESSSGGG